MTTSRKNNVMQIQEIQSLDNLDKYLGCPIITRKVNRDTFREIVEKTKNQLTKWKANNLSQAGRTMLIRQIWQ